MGNQLTTGKLAMNEGAAAHTLEIEPKNHCDAHTEEPESSGNIGEVMTQVLWGS